MTPTSVATKLMRGALASIEKTTLTDVVLFQYNPESIKRSLKPRLSGWKSGESPKEASTRVNFSDAAGQTISFTAYFDSKDADQWFNPVAKALGIAPQLALLEKLINPSVDTVSSAEQTKAGGKMPILTMPAPGTILVWGLTRVLPVRIQSIDITEEAFDALLNPIRASAAISLDVQTYGTRSKDDLEYGRFKSYHQKVETLAKATSSRAAAMVLQAALDS
jgi:Contractile injection system tube protein